MGAILKTNKFTTLAEGLIVAAVTVVVLGVAAISFSKYKPTQTPTATTTSVDSTATATATPDTLTPTAATAPTGQTTETHTQVVTPAPANVAATGRVIKLDSVVAKHSHTAKTTATKPKVEKTDGARKNLDVNF